MDAAVLTGLPSQAADGLNCWDVNGDERMTLESPAECVGGHERVLFLPPGHPAAPFKWALVNWNPHGHIPPGVYDVPHFDVHFFIMDYQERNRIRPGPCGDELVDCADFRTATRPVPAQFAHPDFKDVKAVVPRMGGHLIDLAGAEFRPRPPKRHGRPFTHSFIYGAYGGRITFWEVMLTVAHLRARSDVCTPIKLPARYEIEGSYPTVYCIRYDAGTATYRVSLEEFRARRSGVAYR